MSDIILNMNKDDNDNKENLSEEKINDSENNENIQNIQNIQNTENTQNTQNTQIKYEYEWTKNEFSMIYSTYKKISINSAKLLEVAKSCKKKDSILQYIVVVLGLAASFVSAIPGIENTLKSYITSSFTLITAIVGGMMSKKKYGQKAGLYYSAYQEYKDILTTIDNIMVTFKSDRKYEIFNYHISKIESKYEILLPTKFVDDQEIENDCREKFNQVHGRLDKIENDKKKKQEEEKEIKSLEKYKKFIDYKSYIYLHERKLKMYKDYVDGSESKNVKVLDCYEYENYCRINYPDIFSDLIKKYDEYVKNQLKSYYISKNPLIFDKEKIEMELSTKRYLNLERNDFTKKVYDKFIYYQNIIKDGNYDENNLLDIYYLDEIDL